MTNCFECDAPATEAHHIIPRSLGGKRTVPLCVKCHCLVHDMLVGRRDNLSALTKNALEEKRRREGRKIVNGAPFHKVKIDTRKAVLRSIEVRTKKAFEKQKHLIVLAKELRTKGYKLQQIADLLNKSGYKSSENCIFGCTQISRMIKREIPH